MAAAAVTVAVMSVTSSSTSSITIRSAEENDRPALHELRQQAFSERAASFDEAEDRAYVPLDRRLVAVEGARVVGTLAVWELGQWFGGRRADMGGVAGVAVAPTHRGRGVASALLREAIAVMRRRGEVLSTLHGRNNTLYRRHGWEIAGAHPEQTVLTRALLDLPRADADVALRPVELADLSRLADLYHRVAAAEPGHIWMNDQFAARWVLGTSEQEAYVVETGDGFTGSITFAHDRPAEGDESYSLTVRHLVALDCASELALWRVLAAHHPVARAARFVGPLHRALPVAMCEREVRPAGAGWCWMTRLVDAAGAVAARGWPDNADVEVPLDVVDSLAPWNAGPHVLRVRGGKGTLEPGGSGRVRVEVGRLAAMHTGWSDPRQLAAWGLLRGATDEDLAGLTTAFAGPTPWCRHYF